MRTVFADPAPESVEVYGNLKIQLLDWAGAPRPFGVKVWRGRASKPYAYYSFKTAESRAQYIADQKKSDDLSRQYKEERKAADKVEKAKGSELIQVGTLLAYSWGYDQTNVDFFQVVERTGMTVKIRPIGGRQKKDSEGFMSNRVMPVKDSFIGDEVITKRITGTSLSMGHGSARITHELETHYCSWYA